MWKINWADKRDVLDETGWKVIAGKVLAVNDKS